VESKLRHLVMKLEILETIKLAHPFNKGFDNVHFCETEEEAIRIANGEIKAIDGQAGVKTVVTDLKAEQNGDVEKKEDESKFKVYTTTYYVGLEINTGNHFFHHPRFRMRLPTQKFRSTSTYPGRVRSSSRLVKPGHPITRMSILFTSITRASKHILGSFFQLRFEDRLRLRNIDISFELPDNVFQPGETKPVKKTKKKIIKRKAGAANGGSAKKRSADEVRIGSTCCPKREEVRCKEKAKT